MALITLVLGAGLGREYGFPDGPELRRIIISDLEDHEKELKEIFRWSTAETVDEIAARYPNHANKIRRIVTKVLRDRESELPLEQNDKPNTYKQILRQIANAQEKGNNVQIITFNYDRSLLYLIHKHNSIEVSKRKINTNSIHHVYGRLAPMWFEENGNNTLRKKSYHDYGLHWPTPENYESNYWQDTCLEELSRSSKIFFIGEENVPEVDTIKVMLEKTDQIFFLGIGYHKANMDILGLNFNERSPHRFLAGTGFGLTTDHIKSLLKEYPAIDVIEQCDAYTFLKAKFDISDPQKNLSRKSVSIFDVL